MRAGHLLAHQARFRCVRWAKRVLRRTPSVRSHVTLICPDGTGREVIYTAPRLLEAPNWSADGSYLLLSGEGRLWRLSLDDGRLERVSTKPVYGINSDHGISPDGESVAISAGPIYILPVAGGRPRQITQTAGCYFHSWRPDGGALAYTGKVDGSTRLFRVPAQGGPSLRLTIGPGRDDCPNYTPDGQWVYFNSDRSGSWQIWRIPAAGAGVSDQDAEQVTSDTFENWYPHPSPDNRWLVFLSYEKKTPGHPPNRPVRLRCLPLPGQSRHAGEVREIVPLLGGQGTMNGPSWSPDGKRFAYVSYSIL